MIKSIFFCVSVKLHIVNIFIICFKIKVKKKMFNCLFNLFFIPDKVMCKFCCFL